MRRRVVVTGLGCLTSIGIGIKENWENIIRKNTGLVHIAEHDVIEKSYYAYKIREFSIERFVESQWLKDVEIWKGEKVGKDLGYLLAATRLALDDSKLEYNRMSNNIGMVALHENPGIDEYTLKLSNYLFNILKEKRYADRRSFFQNLIEKFDKSTFELQTFMVLYHLTKIFGLHGYSLFINNACASGLYGIEAASQIIVSKKCPAVIVVAADVVDVFKQMWFEKLGMYSRTNTIKPFSKYADGFILGEGAGALVLEDYEFARERGAHIYAEYIGGEFCLEGWKVTIPDVSGGFYESVIDAATRLKYLRGRKIDVVSPHGVAVPIVDKYEEKAFQKVFKKYHPWIVPFKPYIGHTLGANALLETIFLLLCMDNDFIPSVTYNSGDIDSSLNIPIQDVSAHLEVCLKTCCAFGGYLGCCIFKKMNDE